MSNLKKHLTARIIFYALSTCFTVLTMFYPVSCKKQKPDATQQNIQAIKEAHERLKLHVQTKISALGKANDSLQQQVSQLRAQLTTQKIAHRQRRNRILTTLETPDSTSTPCDSLRREISEYIQSDVQTESIYEAELSCLINVVANKDSTITLLQTAVGESQLLNEKLLTAANDLSGGLSEKQRELKRLRILNKVVTVTALIITSSAIILIL
jgi:myosin heavy subunit